MSTFVGRTQSPVALGAVTACEFYVIRRRTGNLGGRVEKFLRFEKSQTGPLPTAVPVKKGLIGAK